MSGYSGGLNVQATPTRDRDRHPFPPSSHPSPAASLRQSSSSTSASFQQPSSAPSISQASPQTITVDGLLSQHASSPDPTKSALAQAVADRNVLSSQNTQLWKLIEKQRTGYNQILKELDRIRSERDSYKSKLAALSGIPDKRQKSSSERNARPSLDTMSSITSNNHPSAQNRSTPRHNSDEASTPRNQHPHALQPSRSYDPANFRANENGHQSIVTPVRSSSPPPGPPLPPPVTPSSREPSKPSPSPLVVPSRVDTLSTYTVSDSPASSTSSKPSPDDPNTAPNNGIGNGIYAPSTQTTRPLIHPRKSSVADSISSTGSSAATPSASTFTSFSAHTSPHSFGGNHTIPSQQHHITLTPSTAPASYSNPFNSSTESLIARQRALAQAASSPAIVQPPPATGASSLANGSGFTQSQPQMLSVSDPRQFVRSRESQISLPDEASRYIQNMTDSPVASPRTDTFSPKSKLSMSVFPPTADGGSGRESEFLDMEEEEEEEEEAEEEGLDEETSAYDAANTTINANELTYEHVPPAKARSEQDNNTNNTDSRQMGLPYSHADSTNNYSSHSNSSRDELDAAQSKRKERSRVDAEAFPLPPPSNMYMQQRQQGLAGQDQLSQQVYAHPSTHQQQSLAPSHTAQGSSSSKHSQASADHHSSSSHHPSEDSQPPMQETPYSHYRSEVANKSPEPVGGTVDRQFRALPLLSSDLPHTTINVSHSFVRPNDRGKEVLSFIVYVSPGNGKDGWKVEKMYSDVLGLDQRVRNSVGRGVGKKIANLPEGKLWKDHAPAKVDQRKAVLENYLQTLIQLPVKNNDEVIAFFTSDIVRDEKQPVMQAGHKEGYLTKRGKNFGGWKTRFFVLQGPVLEYYDCRGGAHLGSITITGAQIARQHRTERPPSDDEKEYRHAFLIVEAKKGPGGNHPRHVLCAESDEDRDSWVEMLVRYYTGTYSDDLVFNPTSGLTSVQSNSVAAASQQSVLMGLPRSSTSSTTDLSSIHSNTPRSTKTATRGVSRDDISRGSAMPISLLPPDGSNAKLFQAGPTSDDYLRSSSPSRSMDPSPIDRQGPSAAGGLDARQRSLGQPSSLPDSSPLSNGQLFHSENNASGPQAMQRANSEMGHYPELAGDGRPSQTPVRKEQQQQHRPRDESRKSFYPTLNTVGSSPITAVPPQPDRVPSPEKLDASSKVKISGPMNGAPIPSGFKFGGKDAPSAEASAAANDRREKAKSRSFWGFGKANGDKSHPHVAYPPRAVFGVSLDEALDVAQICNLPAIVFRAIQYLEAKKADQEEGIYRLSGSSAVIKNLKDMFNSEGDIDLLASDEYWDPHAIAGLLKSFLRELPSSILTRELHLKFLAVIDFVDPQERIKELSQLIAALPLANYTLLRALTAHLILIVQNSHVNKMTMRNVGIVFSPTLGIPAGVFSLMLGEFNRVFNVDADNEDPAAKEGDGLLENPSEPLRRNSRQYTDAAADQVLGLSGRTLNTTSTEEPQSDGDDYSIQDESGTETTEERMASSSSSSSPAAGQHEPSVRITEPGSPRTPTAKTSKSKAASAAASRGLNVAVTHSERGNRHSRMIGLPTSPRPPQSPARDMLHTGSDVS